MATLELHAQARRVLGKKVRFLRRQGTIPANLYSKGTNSMPMQVDTGDLEKLLSHHGGGGIISLKLEGEKHPRSVVVRELQRDALTGGLIHVDLQQVSMAEEIKVEVPVVLIGEAKLAKTTAATVIQTVNSLMVRCLPRQIPEHIEVDISGFTEPGQAIHLKDLKLGEGVVVLADPEEALAKVVAARIEVEKVEVAAAPEVVAAAPEAGAKAGATE